MLRRRAALAMALSAASYLVAPRVALAHEQPEGAGAAWVMADWMLLIWVLFFVGALSAFFIAHRRGLLRNLEAGKHHILTIEEEDYYTPTWARDDEKEGTDDAERS
jgi:hypothetical protein